MSKRIKTFRFPYFFIATALIVAIFYRSPQGRGVPASLNFPGDEDRRAAISPVVPATRSSVALTPPIVSAPSGELVADLTKVNLPAVRKAVPEPTVPADSSRVPEVPVPAKEKIYLPDSYTHALPATPTIPEGVPPNGVSPSKVNVIAHGNESLNQIALTFDDGPNNKYTPQILNILKQYNIKGTFFVIGKEVEEHPAMLRRIVEEGHEVGNHTFTHPQLSNLSDDRVRQELVSTQDEIRKVLGFAPTMLRPPYGAYRPRNLPTFEELGFHVILWSVDTNDWQRKKTGDAIIRTVSRDARNGSIILFHDRMPETVRVLPQIIEELKGRGLQPVTISEMTGLPPYDTVTPVVTTAPPTGQNGS